MMKDSYVFTILRFSCQGNEGTREHLIQLPGNPRKGEILIFLFITDWVGENLFSLEIKVFNFYTQEIVTVQIVLLQDWCIEPFLMLFRIGSLLLNDTKR